MGSSNLDDDDAEDDVCFAGAFFGVRSFPIFSPAIAAEDGISKIAVSISPSRVTSDIISCESSSTSSSKMAFREERINPEQRSGRSCRRKRFDISAHLNVAKACLGRKLKQGVDISSCQAGVSHTRATEASLSTGTATFLPFTFTTRRRTCNTQKKSNNGIVSAI